MGYTTEFSGAFTVTPALKPEDNAFLTKLAQTRRMGRNLPPEYGIEGEFYVDGKGDFGQDNEPSIINYNRPPKTQPSLWCQWIPNEDGTQIGWDGGEKFYNYVAWIEYIIKWLAPKGYAVSGEVEWQGESSDDFGKIVVTANKVETKQGKKVFA